MPIYATNKQKIKNMYVNVDGYKRKIVSGWINENNELKKIYSLPNTYQIAPIDAHNSWNYTLNDINNTITLNYYTGSETDVIVYANYEIGGKTYKTQLASNSTSGNSAYNAPYMFNGYKQANCRNIQSITFSKDIDTSNVTNMNSMFNQCMSLTSLDVSGLDTSNVTNMSYMFGNCQALANMDLSGLDTSKVTDMSYMFQYCSSLTSLDLSGFDTSNVTNMSYMFYYSSVSSLDISSFDTSKVTNMSVMFQRCEKLTGLDLSSFDTHSVANMFQMFAYCSLMDTIYVTEGKWSTSQATTTNMFLNCGTSSVIYK